MWYFTVRSVMHSISRDFYVGAALHNQAQCVAHQRVLTASGASTLHQWHMHQARQLASLWQTQRRRCIHLLQ